MLSKKERLERIRNILEGKSYLLETNVNVSELEIIESIPVPNKEYAPHINFNYIFFLNKEQVLCTQVFHFQYHEWKWTCNFDMKHNYLPKGDVTVIDSWGEETIEDMLKQLATDENTFFTHLLRLKQWELEDPRKEIEDCSAKPCCTHCIYWNPPKMVSSFDYVLGKCRKGAKERCPTYVLRIRKNKSNDSCNGNFT